MLHELLEDGREFEGVDRVDQLEIYDSDHLEEVLAPRYLIRNEELGENLRALRMQLITVTADNLEDQLTDTCDSFRSDRVLLI